MNPSKLNAMTNKVQGNHLHAPVKINIYVCTFLISHKQNLEAKTFRLITFLFIVTA